MADELSPLVAGTVRIHNLEASARDITLTDGTSVRLGPFSRTGGSHISAPIPKKLIPEAIKKMVTRRWVKFEEVGR